MPFTQPHHVHGFGDEGACGRLFLDLTNLVIAAIGDELGRLANLQAGTAAVCLGVANVAQA